MFTAIAFSISGAACSPDQRSITAPEVQPPQVDVAAKLALMHGKKMRMSVFLRDDDGPRRLVGSTRIDVTSNGQRLHFQSAAATARALSLNDASACCEPDDPPVEPILWNEDLIDTVAYIFTNNALLSAPSVRTDIDSTQVLIESYAMDSTNDLKGMVNTQYGKKNLLESISFDYGDSAYVAADLAYIGTDLTAFTMRFAINSEEFDEIIVEFTSDDLGLAAVVNGDPAAVQALRDPYNCATGLGMMVGGGAALIIEGAILYEVGTFAAGTYTMYRTVAPVLRTFPALARTISGYASKATAKVVAFTVGAAALFMDGARQAWDEC
jgi:hypothetical protein